MVLIFHECTQRFGTDTLPDYIPYIAVILSIIYGYSLKFFSEMTGLLTNTTTGGNTLYSQLYTTNQHQPTLPLRMIARWPIKHVLI